MRPIDFGQLSRSIRQNVDAIAGKETSESERLGGIKKGLADLGVELGRLDGYKVGDIGELRMNLDQLIGDHQTKIEAGFGRFPGEISEDAYVRNVLHREEFPADFRSEVGEPVWQAYADTGVPDNSWDGENYLCYNYASELACRIRQKPVSADLVIVGLRQGVDPEPDIETARPGDIIEFFEGNTAERQHTAVVVGRDSHHRLLVAEAKQTEGQGGRMVLLSKATADANRDYLGQFTGLQRPPAPSLTPKLFSFDKLSRKHEGLKQLDGFETRLSLLAKNEKEHKEQKLTKPQILVAMDNTLKASGLERRPSAVRMLENWKDIVKGKSDRPASV